MLTFISDGQMNHGSQAAHRTSGERDIATVAPGDVTRDGEAQTGAALVEVARRVQPVEGTEDFFHLFVRNAFAVVIDKNVDAAALSICLSVADCRDPDMGLSPIPV